jgi:hypothetical protein
VVGAAIGAHAAASVVKRVRQTRGETPEQDRTHQGGGNGNSGDAA